MKYQEIYAEFTKKFARRIRSRGIGIELELPVVSRKGDVVSMDTVQEMFEFLKRRGFLEKG